MVTSLPPRLSGYRGDNYLDAGGEAEGSLHIKDKSAANSTVFLVCRPRPSDQVAEPVYWEDLGPG